jgi:predicted nucleic acid-binding protein
MATTSLRAVIDTNVLVSGLLHPGRAPAQVLAAVAQGRLQPVVCDAIMAEYALVLGRPRLALPGPDVSALLKLMGELALWVAVPPYTGHPAMPDPADWPFAACGWAVDCPVITGNLRHFEGLHGVRPLSVQQALVWLAGLE